MSTLVFAGTGDFKVFTPISTALANLPNGPGTMICLFKQTSVGDQDLLGLLDAAGTSFYHTLATGGAGVGGSAATPFDDDGLVGISAPFTTPANTTDWYWLAVDWGSGTATEAFHLRDQTTLGAWTHGNSSGNNGGLRAGPGTSGWFRMGYAGDAASGNHACAVIAVWAGTRFASGDYGSWTKTSDLYNHSLGHPTFLCELNATTPVDLIGGSTYSSANSLGTALTGADPDNFTFDGVGSATAAPAPRTFNAIPFMGGVL